MKLTTLYYRHIVPAMTVLFLAVIATFYFLIRQQLQKELDGTLLRTKTRLESYAHDNRRLPEVSTFNDQKITFRRVDILNAGILGDTLQFIPEQGKNHISRKLTFTMLVDGQPWETTIIQPLEGTRHLTILLAETAIVAVLMTLLFFILINRRVLSRLWQPFYKSLEVIQDFRVEAAGRTVYPESPVDEFQLMNAHFGKAAENANREYRFLKEFSENASHELQTPLAILRSNLDLLAQEAMTANQTELVQGIYASVRRMSRLHESLLLLTKIDNRQYSTLDNIRLDLLLQDKLHELQELFHARDLQCRADLVETSIPANRQLLEILLNNLFSNAIRHNIPNGAIHTRLGDKWLCISNTGQEQALDETRIFRRFYKNGSGTDSTGLGLSIIRQICDTASMKVQYTYAGSLHSFTISW